MADIGPGRAMKYPYSILGKVFQFPWKHHWKHGRGFRFIYIAVGLSIPIIYPIHKFGQYLFICLLLSSYLCNPSEKHVEVFDMLPAI